MTKTQRLGPPCNIMTTREWLIRRYGEEKLGHYFQVIHEPSFFLHRRPRGTVDPAITGDDFPAIPPWQFGLGYGLPAGFVARIEDGRVLDTTGAIITPDHTLLADVSHEWIASPQDHSLFKRTLLPPVTRTEETVAVLDAVGGENFFHWMVDMLPRLDLIRKSGYRIDKFVVRDDGKSFQRETLQLLGISADRMIRSHPDLHLEAKRLIVPSRTCESKWAYQFLRHEFLSRVQDRERQRTAWPEKIYISRNSASYRRILNESDVVDCLQRFGFTSVCLEELPLPEQVALFAQAKWIVSPHGAGLTNLAFCRPGTKVAELFSPRFFNPSYFHLSNLMDVEYHFLVGSRAERPEAYQGSAWYYTGLDHFAVDVDRLIDLLKEMGV